MPGIDRRESEASAIGSAKKALSIGISYKDAIQYTQNKRGDRPPTLRGTHRDPDTVVKILTNHFGYKKDDITVLKDDGKHTIPTRDNIIKAFDDLIANAKSGDHFVFHYSGHGGQVEDRNGDEIDGLDETILPADIVYDEEKGDAIENYITDDEIKERLVDRLPAGTFLTIILDACHSGTGADLANVHDSDEENDALDQIWSPVSPIKMPFSDRHNLNQTEQDEENGKFTKQMKESRSQRFRFQQPEVDKHVTCWAACVDSEIEIECSKGGMLTQAFHEVFKRKQTYTHAELRTALAEQLVKSTLPAKKHFLERGFGRLNCPRPVFSSWKKLDDVYHLPFSF